MMNEQIAFKCASKKCHKWLSKDYDCDMNYLFVQSVDFISWILINKDDDKRLSAAMNLWWPIS